MAREVRILSQTYLPGGGFTTSGKPKQGKTMVTGQINITSYVVVDAAGTTGDTLTASDMGLNNVDNVTFTVLKGNGTSTLSEIEGGQNPSASWLIDAGRIQAFDDASVQLVAGDKALIGFTAFGDSARDVETLA